MKELAQTFAQEKGFAFDAEIEQSLKILKTLATSSGSLASSKTGHYNSIWIRDNLFCSFALEIAGQREQAIQIARNVFEILLPYKDKISEIVEMEDPFQVVSYIPSRFTTEDHQELPQEISYLHLDLPGLFLKRIAQFEEQGVALIDSEEKEEFIQLMVTYLEKMEYPDTLEYGIWEEGPERHTSTIGCAISGIEAIRKIRPKIKFSKKMMAVGEQKLKNLLPKESATRPIDFCLLSLVWPLNILPLDQSKQLIDNVAKELEKRKGLIRYSEDGYYNPRPDSPRGTEPRWPLGFAWLSITSSVLAAAADVEEEEEDEAGDDEDGATPEHSLEPAELHKSALDYLDKCRQQKDILGQLPELISGGEPNINNPHAWTQAFYIAACALGEYPSLTMEVFDPVAAEAEKEEVGAES